MRKTSKSSTYTCWVGMRQRCNNPKAPQFHHYGGRGIRVCERWNSFENFYADMGDVPYGKSLERIDVDGDYEPTNCRWATQKEQMRNMRITRRVTVEGQTYVAADLADELGVKTDTIVKRAKVCKTYDELMSPERRVFHDGLALGAKISGAKRSARTHCKHGHEYTPENTYMRGDGGRQCRECHNAKMRRRYASKR